MTAQDAYRRLVRDHIAPALRALGFRGSGASYQRRAGEDWQVVNLQKSAYSTRDQIRFTINLGVGLTAQRGGLRDWPDDKAPTVHQCQVSERIGFTGDSGLDLWWELAPDSDLDAVARAVLGKLSPDGMAWLDRAHEQHS